MVNIMPTHWVRPGTYLVRALKSEEVERAQQIIVNSQKLQVQFWQRQHASAVILPDGNEILIPQQFLVGEKRQIVQLVNLALSSLILSRQLLEHELPS